jgi:hypothetical protein
MKHGIVHFLQKYLFNPPIKFLFAIGLVPRGWTRAVPKCTDISSCNAQARSAKNSSQREIRRHNTSNVEWGHTFFLSARQNRKKLANDRLKHGLAGSYGSSGFSVSSEEEK